MSHIDATTAQQFLRDALPADRRAAVAAHVADCAACAELIEQERRLSALLRFDEHTVAAEGAIERAIDRVSDVLPTGWVLRWRPWYAPLALGALGALGFVLLLRSGAGADRELDASAAGLGISAELQQRVVAHLDELSVLQEQPWIIDDYETIETLSRLVTAEAFTP
ncbi:MAG: hypothetical protein AB7Q17_18250 [Phycisphaerae bacterium]